MLVAGFRGAPPADAHALFDVLLRLSRLAEDVPEVAELDLNPVLAFPDRCVAVDARIGRAAASAHRRQGLVTVKENDGGPAHGRPSA